MKPSRVYKLTNPDLTTYHKYQWVLGETRTFSGTGDLCGPGWAHAYTHPLLAVLLNPLHANLTTFRLFEAEGMIGKTDHGLKVGCSTLTLTKELPVPVVTSEHRVHFALLCALEVYHEPSFTTWAVKWLSSQDRTEEAAWAAWAAAGAAREAAGAAGEAGEAGEARGDFNLIEMAEAACADLLWSP